MTTRLTVTDEGLEALRPLFSQVEGNCEVWSDGEILTRLLVRGVMAYGQTAGREFSDMSALAAQLREQIETG